MIRRYLLELSTRFSIKYLFFNHLLATYRFNSFLHAHLFESILLSMPSWLGRVMSTKLMVTMIED